MFTSSRIPSKRCFFCDLPTGTFVANSRETVRLMGVAINLEKAVDNVKYPGDVNEDNSCDYEDLRLLTLDDGTATVGIFLPYAMIEKLELLPGETVECIAWLRQRGDIKNWYAYCISRITDPHLETLRWLELSHKLSPDETMRWGYPTTKRNASMALRLITAHSSHNKDGVKLKDLALVMQETEDVVQEMLVELQLSAQIYQNQAGNYVPL